MARYHDARRTYEGTARFIDAAMRRDDSLFTPGRAIWSTALLDELDLRFIQQPDLRTDVGFEDKLRGQLADAGADVYQLMGEILYLYYFPARWNITGPTKRQRINEVLSWSPSPVSIPADLDAILDDGVASGGTAFSNRKPAIIAQLIRYLQAWKRLGQADRDAALADPWAFKQFLVTIPVEEGAYYARESILHIVHPDTFERIFSRSEKWRLIDALKDVAPEDEDNDRRLWGLRQIIGARVGEDFDWYDTVPACALWRKFDDPWVGYLFWAGRFHGLSTFDRDERDYKLTIAERMGHARTAVLAGDEDWVAKLKRAYGSPNNITSFHGHGSFTRWVEANPVVARDLLANLWGDEGDALERFEAFTSEVPTDAVRGRGVRANVLGLLLLAIDPHSLPPFKTTELERSYRLVGFDPRPPRPMMSTSIVTRSPSTTRSSSGPRAPGSSFAIASTARGSCGASRTTTRLPRNGQPRNGRGSSAGEAMRRPPRTRRRTISRRAAHGRSHRERPRGPHPRPGGSALARRGLPARIAQLLHHKRQVVFYGPPGTGKTFVARKLAGHIARHRGGSIRFSSTPATRTRTSSRATDRGWSRPAASR